MGIILLGLLIGALLIGIIFKYKMNEGSAMALMSFAFLFVIMGAIVGISMPVSGYEEPKIVSVTEIVSLEEYNTISDNNVKIVEDDSYTNAKLVTYVMRGKKTFWTFAAWCNKYEYVLYLPMGTITSYSCLG